MLIAFEPEVGLSGQYLSQLLNFLLALSQFKQQVAHGVQKFLCISTLPGHRQANHMLPQQEDLLGKQRLLLLQQERGEMEGVGVDLKKKGHNALRPLRKSTIFALPQFHQ